MKSLKKMLLLAVTALTATALVAPGLAQADRLVNGNGNFILPGSYVEFKSTDFTVVFTGVGTLKCGNVTLKAELLENAPTEVKLRVPSSKYEECSTPAEGKHSATIIRLTGGKTTMTDYAFDWSFCSQKGTLNGTYALGASSLGVSGTFSGCYLGTGYNTATFSMKDVLTGTPATIK